LDLRDLSEQFVKATRHGPEHRIFHWVLFGAIGLLVFTGIEMYFGITIFGGFSIARTWHMIFAYLAAFWAYIVFLYFYWATGELGELMPARGDPVILMQMAKNFLGFSTYYPEHSTYDVKVGKYYRKYNPGQKLVYGGILFFLLLQGVTGFAMFWMSPLRFITEALGGIANVRALHLVFSYVILGLVATHIYMAIIPPNWQALRSMFFGTAMEPIRKSTD
jgi:Ni/Fe-hydrogenase 1 B-type cytochrome subunit